MYLNFLVLFLDYVALYFWALFSSSLEADLHLAVWVGGRAVGGVKAN